MSRWGRVASLGEVSRTFARRFSSGGWASAPAATPLRAVVEASEAWRRVAPQLIAPDPSATWQAYDLHYFRYELVDDSSGGPPHALFIVHAARPELVSAVIVTPRRDGRPARTVDLLRAAALGMPAQGDAGG